MADNNVFTIQYLRGANFVPIELNRTTVNTLDQLRTHMEISARASITVRSGDDTQSVQKDGSYVVQDGDYIAAVESDKTGG